MKDDLPQRKRNRLKDYDYSKKGMYFITMCIKKECKFSMWQKSYHDHIIRNEKEYIRHNIMTWEDDLYSM